MAKKKEPTIQDRADRFIMIPSKEMRPANEGPSTKEVNDAAHRMAARAWARRKAEKRGRRELQRTPSRPVRCFRCLLLVMCKHPLAKDALTLHLARSEGHERYFGGASAIKC